MGSKRSDAGELIVEVLLATCVGPIVAVSFGPPYVIRVLFLQLADDRQCDPESAGMERRGRDGDSDCYETRQLDEEFGREKMSSRERGLFYGPCARRRTGAGKLVCLFPVTWGELVPQDHVCRVIDAFVNSLDMAGLGFERAEAAETGRPGYDPRDRLKLFGTDT